MSRLWFLWLHLAGLLFGKRGLFPQVKNIKYVLLQSWKIYEICCCIGKIFHFGSKNVDNMIGKVWPTTVSFNLATCKLWYEIGRRGRIINFSSLERVMLISLEKNSIKLSPGKKNHNNYRLMLKPSSFSSAW